MPNAKKPSAKKSSTDKVKFQGFVGVYLTKQEKEAIKNEIMSEDAVIHFIEDMCATGYKMSVSRSSDGKVFTVTAYGNHPDNLNAGWAMSLRHVDLLTAFTALQFTNEHHGVAGDWNNKNAFEGEDDW